jgi:hypothetical protein
MTKEVVEETKDYRITKISNDKLKEGQDSDFTNCHFDDSAICPYPDQADVNTFCLICAITKCAKEVNAFHREYYLNTLNLSHQRR